MDQSFSRSQFPPGGWQFYQSQTGWSNPMPMATTFDQCVRKIIEMREKNPAICIRHRLSRDPIVVGNELEDYTRLRIGQPRPAPNPPSFSLPGIPLGVVGTVDEIKRLAFGSSLVIDWAEGTESPVPIQVAEARAATCANCPNNSLAKFEEWQAHPLSSMFKMRVARLSAMKLSTRNDAKLGLCSALFAPTMLLVHEPEEIVRKKIAQKNSVNLAECCWLRK
jgi:hypothetical protein